MSDDAILIRLQARVAVLEILLGELAGTMSAGARTAFRDNALLLFKTADARDSEYAAARDVSVTTILARIPRSSG